MTDAPRPGPAAGELTTYGQPPPPPPGNGMAIAGFVLALCAYPLFWLVVPWILGVVFSGIGLYRSQFLPGRAGKGLAIAGLALSLGPVALLFVLIVIGAFAG